MACSVLTVWHVPSTRAEEVEEEEVPSGHCFGFNRPLSQWPLITDNASQRVSVPVPMWLGPFVKAAATGVCSLVSFD